MINEADLMMKMEMFVRMNRPGRPMPPVPPMHRAPEGPGCRRPEMPFGPGCHKGFPGGPAFGDRRMGPEAPVPASEGCRMAGGSKHMPMHGGPHHMPPMPPHRPMLGRERLLVLIGKQEGGIRQKELLEKAHIGAPAMSELINKLEDDGYIVRTVDPEDRRATLLSLTEKGQARAAEVEDERAEKFKSAFASLSDEEKETLAAILDKLLLREA